MPLDSVVDVPGLCPPPEPYSYAVRAGDTLYLAGQVALDADGEVVGTTVAEQARQISGSLPPRPPPTTASCCAAGPTRSTPPSARCSSPA